MPSDTRPSITRVVRFPSAALLLIPPVVSFTSSWNGRRETRERIAQQTGRLLLLGGPSLRLAVAVRTRPSLAYRYIRRPDTLNQKQMAKAKESKSLSGYFIFVSFGRARVRRHLVLCRSEGGRANVGHGVMSISCRLPPAAMQLAPLGWTDV